MTNQDYSAILLEEIRGQVSAVLEYVGDIPGIKNRLDNIERDVAELKSDMRVVKVAAVESGRVRVNHEHRIACLEAA